MGLKEPRALLIPHKVNIFGRKRYSTETNAGDYLDYSLDDIWKAICRLWAVCIVLGVFALGRFIPKMKQ